MEGRPKGYFAGMEMTNGQKQQAMRERAAALIDNGAVSYIIGWRGTRFPEKTAVFFVRETEDAEKLVWNEYAGPLTAKYLTDDRWPDKKVGVFARGCDSKAINRLMRDNQLDREKLYIIGIPCEGKAADRCLSCSRKDPVVYDESLWAPPGAEGAEATGAAVVAGAIDSVKAAEAEAAEVKAPKVAGAIDSVTAAAVAGAAEATGAASKAPTRGRFFRVEEVEKLDIDARSLYWDEVYARCIRCYACRNACPVCTCRECYVDMHRTGFQGKRHDTAENRVFGLTRAFHVGDRCIECGECERACPMDLPILGQTQKIISTIESLAGSYESGLDADDENFMGKFDKDDKDAFM